SRTGTNNSKRYIWCGSTQVHQVNTAREIPVVSSTADGVQSRGASSPPEFDLFVVHAEADRAWVDGYLKPMLGLDPARVFTPRDFRLGVRTDVEFERGVTTSRFTPLVLSLNSLV